MPIDLSTIPAERLALLDTAMLYGGSHQGGGPDCQHCARELVYEVVTGEHADATPPGCTELMCILPRLNDGPWRDDEQRTRVMRPYLRRMLLLDPAHDEQRIYAVIDHVYRSVLPDVCDALKLDKHSSALRDLAPIVDRPSARAARAALDALAALAARAALAALAALDARAALDALDALAALDACATSAARADTAASADSWEQGCVAVLDVICAIP